MRLWKVYLTSEVNMPKYEYYAEVYGYEDGEVTAKNKQEALKKAEEEIAMSGLSVAKHIEVRRIPKDEE